MRKSLVLAALAAAVLIVPPTLARADEAAPVDSTLRADILELLEVTGASKVGVQMGAAMSQMMLQQLRIADPSIPERLIVIAQEEVVAIIDAEIGDLMDLIVPLYAKRLTREDVRGLIAFYQSDLGRKAVEVMPAIMQDAMRTGQAWGEQMTPRLIEAMDRRLQKEGYTPKRDG